MADEPDQKPIRRGRGLRLSTQAPDAAETSPMPAAPPEAPATPPPDVPVARRRGLRLSTQPAEASGEPAPVPAPAQPARAQKAARPGKTPAPAPAQPARAQKAARPGKTPAPAPAQPTPAPAPADVAQPAAAQPTPAPAPAAVPAPAPARAQPSRWRIATATGPISFLAAGVGEPLLLLHGFGATARIWGGTMDALADLRSLYALDLPGFGESPQRAAAPTLQALAEEVIACADALGLARFDLMGHSLGAAVAAVLAGRHPGRVGRLIVVSLGARPFAPELAAIGMTRTPVDLTLGLARPLLDLWQPVGRAMMQSPPLAMTLGALVLHGRPASPELWHGYLADHASSDPRAYLTSLAAVGDPVLHSALRAIVAPTLCVAGREDRVARLPETTAAQTMIPRSRLAVIEACGHIPMLERPDAFHEALRGFL